MDVYLYWTSTWVLYGAFIPHINLVLAQVYQAGGLVTWLHRELSLVGKLCDFICLYARMQWRLL
jgi:hypothetical protein